jgi:cytochrome c biogenesis protein ResB
MCIFLKLDKFLKKAKHFREKQNQRKKQTRENRQEANLPDAKKKKAKILSPEEKRAANIRAANSAAFSQLSTTPKFMQKLKDGATSSTKEKQPFFKGPK